MVDGVRYDVMNPEAISVGIRMTELTSFSADMIETLIIDNSHVCQILPVPSESRPLASS